jgi:hypothetical protein
LGDWLYAFAQGIQEFGRLARINATMDQSRYDFIVGTLFVPQPGGQVDVRSQNFMCHACGELLYRQTAPDTSQQL